MPATASSFKTSRMQWPRKSSFPESQQTSVPAVADSTKCFLAPSSAIRIATDGNHLRPADRVHRLDRAHRPGAHLLDLVRHLEKGHRRAHYRVVDRRDVHRQRASARD